MTYAGQLYAEYKRAVQAVPPHRGKQKRKVISYKGFLVYLYMFRRLGLIEYVTDTAGERDTEPAFSPGGTPLTSPRYYFQIVTARISDPAWENPWRALKG